MSFWDTVMSMHQKLDELSYYELLGVDNSATTDVIRERYYSLAKRLHPDRHARLTDKNKRTAVTQLFARMGEAHDVLTTPARRKTYDEQAGSGGKRLSTTETRKALKRDPNHPLARQPEPRDD
jgi:curved DNA-binding protein CbpA